MIRRVGREACAASLLFLRPVVADESHPLIADAVLVIHNSCESLVAEADGDLIVDILVKMVAVSLFNRDIDMDFELEEGELQEVRDTFIKCERRLRRGCQQSPWRMLWTVRSNKR